MPLFTMRSSDPKPYLPKTRRNSTKMSSSPSSTSQPAMLPYRDNLTGNIKYASASSPPRTQYSHPYDSDAEPLFQESAAEEQTQKSGLTEYEQQHFTATGRPAPQFKASGLANLGGHMFTMPQLLPKQYTDDSVIPAIITDVIPSVKMAGEEKKKGGLLGKLKGSGKKEEGDGKLLKVVYMPRREYQRFFARNQQGGYIGSEEHRRWTEEELEVEFGRYKPEPTQQKRNGLLSGTGNAPMTAV